MCFQVQLATDLSLANSQLATVQLEIGALKKHEGEIKQQLEGFINSGSQQKDDILKFKTMAAGQLPSVVWSVVLRPIDSEDI